MIYVEAIRLVTLANRWRTTVHSSLLNASFNPGNPAFPMLVRHLQEALAGSIDPITVAAALGALGLLLTRVGRSSRPGCIAPGVFR